MARVLDVNALRTAGDVQSDHHRVADVRRNEFSGTVVREYRHVDTARLRRTVELSKSSHLAHTANTVATPNPLLHHHQQTLTPQTTS